MQRADPAAIEAEIERIRSLGIDELRKQWRMTFGSIPPRALTKDLIARMIAYRLQEEAFGGLDRATVKLLDRLARGEKPELNRRLKAGTVLVREYRDERHNLTIPKTQGSSATIFKSRCKPSTISSLRTM
jgi:hypothetical protein